jgi:hypothetical protein
MSPKFREIYIESGLLFCVLALAYGIYTIIKYWGTMPRNLGIYLLLAAGIASVVISITYGIASIAKLLKKS